MWYRDIIMGDFKLKIQEALKEIPTEYEDKIRSEIDALYIKRDAIIKRRREGIKRSNDNIAKKVPVPDAWKNALHELEYQERQITQRIHNKWELLK